MAENNDGCVAVLPIPPEARLRSDRATSVPLINPLYQSLPTSIASYQRRLSRENREELEEQRELLDRAKRDL